MANVIIRKIILNTVFQPLTSQRLIGNFTIRTHTDSAGVLLRTDDEQDEVPLGRGDEFMLNRVNLQDIFAKGSLGDIVYVIGATAT